MTDEQVGDAQPQIPPDTGAAPPDSRRLLQGVRTWLWVVASLSGIDSLAWFLIPDLAASGAYSWARQFLPQRGWATLMGCASLLGFYALIFEGRGKSAPVNAARASLAIYSLVTLAVGLSIFVLAIDGTARGALTGASKWWLPFLLSVRTFAAPTILMSPSATPRAKYFNYSRKR